MTHPDPTLDTPPLSGWRARCYTIIFEADTRAGKAFDVALLIAVLLSVALVIAESVADWRLRFDRAFDVAEYLFTALFTVEYVLRVACVPRPWRYVRSFYGIVDLLAVLPTYLALFMPEAYALVDVRILRLLRIFRVLKLSSYVLEYTALLLALRASRRKIGRAHV